MEEEDEFLHSQSDKWILRQQASVEQKYVRKLVQFVVPLHMHLSVQNSYYFSHFRPIPTQSPIYSRTHASGPHLHSPPSSPQRLLLRNDSTTIKPSPVKPHPLMTTMNAFTRVHSSPSIRTKQQQRQQQYRRKPIDDGYVDLTLTSARIVSMVQSIACIAIDHCLVAIHTIYQTTRC